MTTNVDEGHSGKRTIRLTIPERFYLVPGAAVVVGCAIGIVRGGRTTSLRFLAENAHRPPTTVQGWYFYNKTKNYKVMLGAMKGAAVDAGKLSILAGAWVGIEEGLKGVGWGDVSDVGAAVGTAGMFSAVYRLPWKVTRRTLMLGLIMGCTLKALKWSRHHLETRQVELRDIPEEPESVPDNKDN